MTHCLWWKSEPRHTLRLCVLCGVTKWQLLRPLPADAVSLKCPLSLKRKNWAVFLNMQMHHATYCLSLHQSPVVWELTGWLKLKGDVKCCLKWIRKAAGFIFTHSVTCAAKRKQVTKECVLKLKCNTGAQMICCHLCRYAFLFVFLTCFNHLLKLCTFLVYHIVLPPIVA